MAIKIFHKNGIILKIDDKEICLDPNGQSNNSDLIFISHAHLDHTSSIETVTPKICSKATKELVKHRRRFSMINTITLDSFEFGGMRIKQFNSGHIIGSTSLLVETKNKKIFYTGDICDKHRFHIEGARVPRSDIMIIESTYGNPYYILPNIHEIVEWSRKWTKESLENNNSVILTGYALGKAQVLTKLIDDFDYPIIIHDSIHKINEICRKFGFDYSKIIPYSTAGNIIKNEKFIGIFPSSSMYLRLIKKLKTKFETKIATFSGWSLNPLYKHQLGVDEAFPLSDHSDFNGLLKIIKESNPEKVYTTHGFAADLAHQIKARLGIDAEAIMEERNNLKDFIS